METIIMGLGFIRVEERRFCLGSVRFGDPKP